MIEDLDLTEDGIPRSKIASAKIVGAVAVALFFLAVFVFAAWKVFSTYARERL